ncbi:protein adenylyltransferase SelO family protein [Olleya sp. YS]|uniref:protein adenylyltransferase SelO n=1 Tax=Olleya sp. YS TaxID=3028318 RepID=UPI0024344487|nr:YdiU family protein [Olleya sp. YS]WGD34750.1 YdiU family protein [Olleya sp. YS]
MIIHPKHTFTNSLPADSIVDNSRRQVTKACYSYVTPKKTSNPKLLHVSPEMLKKLGLSENDAKTKMFLNIFTGNTVLENTKPYSMCYGGHQFGHWAGQLGDGRAINLFEIEHDKQNWKLQLKGAGETPYSRTADGLAVLRSSIREYLCSEAMHHLGVPTTRALSLALSGDQVLRDVMYNGNPDYEKGAIVCRVSPSFLRFGSFEIFAARNDIKTLKTLVDYTINTHFKHLGKPNNQAYLSFFNDVAIRNLDMVIHWQRVGFTHGVMNTDNLSILGLTIDYGPYGWLEGYEPSWTPNTTDSQHKRYRFGAQPDIVHWNLYQLANALYPLIEEAEGLEAVLANFAIQKEAKYLQMMRSKIGLSTEEPKDANLIQELEDCLQLTETDMTIFFRNLADFDSSIPTNGLQIIRESFYEIKTVTEAVKNRWNLWFDSYADRLKRDPISAKAKKENMNSVNPKYVLRNYMAQLAIDDANKGDYKLIDELFNLLKQPYEEQPKHEKWFAKRPEWARHKVGCSMLSCSS